MLSISFMVNNDGAVLDLYRVMEIAFHGLNRFESKVILKSTYLPPTAIILIVVGSLGSRRSVAYSVNNLTTPKVGSILFGLKNQCQENRTTFILTYFFQEVRSPS